MKEEASDQDIYEHLLAKHPVDVDSINRRLAKRDANREKQQLQKLLREAPTQHPEPPPTPRPEQIHSDCSDMDIDSETDEDYPCVSK